MIPLVSSYFRTHEGQRYQTRLAIEAPAARRYQKDVVRLWSTIALGTEEYVFRDPEGRPLGRVAAGERPRFILDAMSEWIARVKIIRFPPIHTFRYAWRKVSARRHGAGGNL